MWSEDGTTYLYTRVHIDIEGIMNPEAMAYATSGSVPTDTPGALPPVTTVAVRHYLLQPRAKLVVSTPDGVSFVDPIVVEKPDMGFPVDVNNGPRPLSCTVRDFAGARTWYITWTCETWIHECPNEDDIIDPLISNRYSQTDDIDEQWKTTRVTTGVAMFRTDILTDTKKVADDFRHRVMPGTPPGFQRRKISVTAVPNRNALHWSVTDEERMYDLGDTSSTLSYITDVEGTYGVSSIATTPHGIPGGQSLGQLFIRVRGDKRASNWVLTQRAFALAAGKLPLGQVGPGYMQQVSINQSLVDRDVSLNIVYLFVPQQNAILGSVALDSLRVDSIFPNFNGRNPSPPWAQGTAGTSKLKLLVAALEDACSGPAIPLCNQQNPVGGDGGQPCGPPPAVAVTSSDQLPSYPTKYSTPGQQNPYNQYTSETRYDRVSGLMMAPIAGPTSSSTSGSYNQPTASFFRIHQPISTVVVRWKAERVGAPVQIPAPDNYNTNYVLLDHEIVPMSPQVMPDGVTLVFRAEGEYTYGAQLPMRTDEQLGMGALPWVAANFVDLSYGTSDYQHGIFDDANGGSGSGPNFA